MQPPVLIIALLAIRVFRTVISHLFNALLLLFWVLVLLICNARSNSRHIKKDLKNA